jgi:hypothetical protein
VTNARVAALHGLLVALFPLDDARSASQTARSSRAVFTECRISDGLPSVARRRALRSGCDSLKTLLSALRSTFPARRPQTEARKSAYAGEVTKPSITDCKIASHSACRRDSAMKPPLIVWRRWSRQGYYGSLVKRSRFRSSFDPIAAARGVLPLGFHRGNSVCSKEDLTGLP